MNSLVFSRGRCWKGIRTELEETLLRKAPQPSGTRGTPESTGLCLHGKNKPGRFKAQEALKPW